MTEKSSSPGAPYSRKKQSSRKKTDSRAKTGTVRSLLLSLIPLVLAVILFLLAGTGSFAEWYAVKIYPDLVDIGARISGKFSFSLTEILLYLLLLYLLLRLILAVIRKKNGGKWFKKGFLCWLRHALLLIGCLALMFMLGGGINYQRRPFSEVAGFNMEKSSSEELYRLARKMAEQVAFNAELAERDADGLLILPDSLEEDLIAAMSKLGDKYEAMQGNYPEPKTLLLNDFLAVQQLSGVFSPFTLEAHYNRTMTAYNIPFTACHELSHLRGFMREDEANFVAFLACIGSDESYVRYSGYLLGYIYASNALYGEDRELWREVRALLPGIVLKDLEENSAYWAQYETKVAEVAEKVNDTYLKVNGQSDGVKSYGRVVDLMLAWQRSR